MRKDSTNALIGSAAYHSTARLVLNCSLSMNMMTQASQAADAV